MINKNKIIILGTSSPVKINQFKKLGYNFKAVNSEFEENLDKSKYNIHDYVKYTAYNKGINIINNYKDFDILITSDIVVYYNNKIYEKPCNIEENIKYYQELSGNKIYSYNHTYIFYIDNNELKYKDFGVESSFIFKQIKLEQIIDIINNDKSLLDKAGGISISDYNYLFNDIKGDYDSIVGIPTNRIKLELEQLL